MAEGIKISEMEQVTTLEEGCCFPVVSNGKNKKITQKNLYNLMTKDLFEKKVPYYSTVMTSLGLDDNTTVVDFWKKIYQTYGSNGVINFGWNHANGRTITDGTRTIDINGGFLIFSCTVFSTWQAFSAIYVSHYNDEIYKIKCNIGDDTNNPNQSIFKLVDTNITNNLQNIIDSNKTDLQNQITNNDNDISNLNNYKTNYNYISMVDLGHTANSIVSVRDFWLSLYSSIGKNGVIQFVWNYDKCASIGNANTNVSINSGTLIYSCTSYPIAWQYFSAIYYNGNDIYNISCSIPSNDGSDGAEVWSINKLGTYSNITNLQNIIDSNKTDLQSQIDSNKTDLQNQIDSNDTDITDLQNQIDNKVNIEDLFLNNSSMTVQATTNTILLNFYKPDGLYAGALEIDTDEENPSINFRLGPSNYLVSTKNMNILIQSAFQEINSLKERVSQLEGK